MSEMFTMPKNVKPIDISGIRITQCPPAKPFIEAAKRRQAVAIAARKLELQIDSEMMRKEECEAAERRNRNRRAARRGKQARREFFF